MTARTSLKLNISRRIARLRRTVQIDTQQIRAKALKDLNELFDLAMALARGEVKTQTEGGKTVRVTLKQRQMFQNNSGTAAQPALEAGKQSQETKKNGKGEGKTLSQEIAELQTMITELSEQVKTLNASKTDLETQNKTLKASLDAIAAERHVEKIQKLLELRAKANLFDASKRNEEAERLGKLSDQVLDQLIVDTENIIKALPKPSGPKATYTAEQINDNEERVRERLFGYRRDKDGKIVAGGV